MLFLAGPLVHFSDTCSLFFFKWAISSTCIWLELPCSFQMCKKTCSLLVLFYSFLFILLFLGVHPFSPFLIVCVLIQKQNPPISSSKIFLSKCQKEREKPIKKYFAQELYITAVVSPSVGLIKFYDVFCK